MSRRRRSSCIQQLVGNPRQLADHDHRLNALVTTHNLDKPLDGSGILDRGATELHDNNLVVLLESAGLRFSTHRFSSISSISAKRKTHRQIAPGGGFG